MDKLQAFYEKYKIDEFYEKQKNLNFEHPIRPFQPERHKKLSHGVIPGFRNYDLWFERYRSAVEVMKAKNVIKPGDEVLDVGCGEGFFKIFFDALYDGELKWNGVEVWKSRAAFCRHIGYTNVDEVDLEKGKLPYEDETFDVLIASHVIEHLPNPDEILREFARVLKKGGVMLVATPTKLPVIAHIGAWIHNMNKRNRGETQQAFTAGKLKRFTLKALGLPKSAIVDRRGFRIISGRKKLPIENWTWFYRFSKFLGRNCMFFVPEINLIVKK
ncbi:MAG: hypothetical protein C0592_06605 [Marinilabiliales bacterium]|nr:MAG: hypothetical protein C0592_06605 [Marinilabiliales bacterium]